MGGNALELHLIYINCSLIIQTIVSILIAINFRAFIKLFINIRSKIRKCLNKIWNLNFCLGPLTKRNVVNGSHQLVGKWLFFHKSRNKFDLIVCLFVSNKRPTAEPISGPNFFTETYKWPREGQTFLKLKKNPSILTEKSPKICLFLSIERQNDCTNFWNSYDHIFRHCISWSKLFKGKNIKLS